VRDAPLAHAYTNWDPESDSHGYGKSDWDPNRAASSHTDPEAASHTGAAPDSAVDEAVLGCQLSVNYSATLTTALAFLCIAATAPEVIFVSPCECHGFHGKNRWVAKTDLTPVPSDKSVIQSVTPSQIYAWEGLGPDVDLTQYTEARMPSEQKWYALTGRIVEAKVEANGDIHIALVDASGNKVGTVSGSFAFS
jgi:hypothetical protein